MRVNELAKELSIQSKVLLSELLTLGIVVKAHSSLLSDTDITKVRLHYKKQADPPAPDQEPLIEELPAESSKQKVTEPVTDLEIIEIEDRDITVKDFATLLKVPLTQVMTSLLKKGMMLNLNQNIDLSLAEEIAQQYNIVLDVKNVAQTGQQKRVEDAFLAEYEEEERFLKDRPPVVTVMGHVDHGKTKLLDAIRHTNVMDKEAGGITQHIGAYQVHVHGKDITFIDTPGHEAFTEIRARGANITDIVVLVVAADDGIMPQTIEAIHHARAAKVPILVAINKMDKPDANIERVKQQLTEHDLVPEEWGGKTVVVPVSAKAGQGISDLLDMILLIAETEELKANPHKKAVGIVLEAHLSKNKGPIATVLIKSGTLRIGNPFVIGPVSGKIRALVDDLGQKRKEATPATPIEIMGLSGVPNAGDVLQVVSSDKEAREIADQRKHELVDSQRRKTRAVSLEDVSLKIREGEMAVLNLVVKADVIGSLEAILGSINKLKVDQTAVSIVHSGTGDITESDLMLAKASSAILIGFNVAIPIILKNKAEEDGVVVKLYHIIYKLLDDLEGTLKGLLKPEFERVQIGIAEVRAMFKFSKVGVIAGCYVTEGKVIRNVEVEIFRGTNLIFEGKISSLKRFKDDAKEVLAGYECGIVIDGFMDFAQGDQVRIYALKEIKK